MDKLLSVFVLFLTTIKVVLRGVSERGKKTLLDFYHHTDGTYLEILSTLSKSISTWNGRCIENDLIVSTTLFRKNFKIILPNSMDQFNKYFISEVHNILSKFPENIIPLSKPELLTLKNNILIRYLFFERENLKRVLG